MTPASRGLIFLGALAAAATCASAQSTGAAVGNWQSPTSWTFANPLHPALTGAEIYLNIDVAPDGSFRGDLG